MKDIPPCFFAICTNKTENECIKKGLFGDKESRLQYLKSIKKGDFGFLLNITKNQLLGIFAAESKVRLNIGPNAWEGNFPAQVKVKLLGNLQRIKGATQKLGQIVELREIKEILTHIMFLLKTHTGQKSLKKFCLCLIYQI